MGMVETSGKSFFDLMFYSIFTLIQEQLQNYKDLHTANVGVRFIWNKTNSITSPFAYHLNLIFLIYI